MNRSRLRIVAMAFVLCGCRGGSGIAGVYRASGSLQELILNSDGTYRTMVGERTSPADRQGRFTLSGSTITLTDDRGGSQSAQLTENTISWGGMTFTKE